MRIFKGEDGEIIIDGEGACVVPKECIKLNSDFIESIQNELSNLIRFENIHIIKGSSPSSKTDKLEDVLYKPGYYKSDLQTTYVVDTVANKGKNKELNVRKLGRNKRIELILIKLDYLIDTTLENKDKKKFMFYTQRKKDFQLKFNCEKFAARVTFSMKE